MVSQGRFERPTFPLGGPIYAQQAKENPSNYSIFSPIASEKTDPYSVFCTHIAPTEIR